jgi:hypothetical protein
MLSNPTAYPTNPTAFAKSWNILQQVVRARLTFTSSTDRSQSERCDCERHASDRSFAALLPIMAAVLIAVLIIGVAPPVLPLHVHHGLGLSAFVVGLVTGSQFAASLISRVWAGHYADSPHRGR